MRTAIDQHGVTLWASARDTYAWAHRPGESWPCSQLSGRRVVACFDRNGLCDLSIDGGRGDQDVDGNELSALCADMLAARLPKDHPAYFVAVGQFLAAPRAEGGAV